MQTRYPATFALSMLPSFRHRCGHPGAIRKDSCLVPGDDQISAFLIVQVDRLWIEGQPDLVVDVDGADAHDLDRDL